MIAVRASASSVVLDRLTEDKVTLYANEATRRSAEGKHVAYEPEAERSNGCVHDVLVKDIDMILVLDSTNLEHRESRLHEEDHGACAATTSVSKSALLRVCAIAQTGAVRHVHPNRA